MYVTLGGRWYDIIVLNVHAPTEDKSDYTKNSLYEELECIGSLPEVPHENLIRRFQCKSRERRYFQINNQE
jgi:hypothetical protein